MKNKFNQNLANQKGFTVVELLIATAIFAVLLMIALVGFGGIGRLFYKGVSLTQTQQLTSQVLSDITQNIQNGPTGSTWTNPTSPYYLNGNGYTYYCSNGIRYTLQLGHEIDPNTSASFSPGGNFALIRDVLPGNTACAAPCQSGCKVPFNNPSEMLGNRMRLVTLDIASAGARLYTVDIKVAYGDDIDFSNVNNPATIECQGGLQDQQFCAVDSLSAAVYQGPN